MNTAFVKEILPTHTKVHFTTLTLCSLTNWDLVPHLHYNLLTCQQWAHTTCSMNGAVS